jgi:type IV pilus assembly protein PilC
LQVYRWTARNREGRRYAGEFRADNEMQVAAFVRSNYGYVTGIKPVVSGWRFARWLRSRKRVTDFQRAQFFHRLDVLLVSGIPILRAMGMMQEKMGSSLVTVCRKLCSDLRQGKSLAESMKRQQEVFPEMAVAIVDAGEMSGNMHVALDSLASHYGEQDELRKYIRNACVYPVFLLVFTSGTMLFFIIRVIPMFLEMYASFSAETTLLLKVLGGGRDLVLNHYPFILVSMIILMEFFWYYKHILSGWLKKFPPIKKIRGQYLEVRFLKLLALMLQSGIPLPQAILAAARALEDAELQKQAGFFAGAVIRGISLTEAASMSRKLFSDLALEFASVGESSGRLPEMLLEAVVILKQDLLTLIHDTKALMEPVLLIVIAGLVLAMVVSVLSPMFSLVTQLPEYG